MSDNTDYWFANANGMVFRTSQLSPNGKDILLPTPYTLSEPGKTSIWLFSGNLEFVCLINTETQIRTYQVLEWDVELEQGESSIIFEHQSKAKEPAIFALLQWYHLVRETLVHPMPSALRQALQIAIAKHTPQ
jgi:hypothetical protein